MRAKENGSSSLELRACLTAQAEVKPAPCTISLTLRQYFP
jgi:hypothetical protein